MTHYEINIRDFWRIIRKRKTIIFFSTLSLGIFYFIFNYLNQPIPIYQSVASVKIQRSTTLAGLYLETITWNPEDNISTQVEVIKSFPIVEQVARKLEYIDSTLTYEQILADDNSVNAVLDIMSGITAEQDGTTNIINIIVHSNSPEQTQQIANTTAHVYMQQGNLSKNERAINALNFINKQLGDVGQKLHDAEEAVRKYREDENVITLENKADLLARELERAHYEYNRLKQRRTELDLVIENLDNQNQIPTENFIELNFEDQSQTYVNLSNQLAQLYVKRDNLLIDYTPQHPDVMQTENRIKELIKSIVRELKAQRVALKRREELEAIQIDKLTADYQQIPKNGLELNRLMRKVQLNEELYTFLESKLQEALIQNAEKINEITIVKPALRGYNVNPPPSIITTLMIGLFIGLLTGLVIAFIFESMDTSFGTIEEVEKFLDIPVMGIIPHTDRKNIMEKIKSNEKAKQVPDEILEMNAMLVSHFAPKSSMAESYRALRTNVQHLTTAKNMKTLIFTSSSTKEGKSTTVANLAIMVSQIGFKTLLIDGDLRKPSIYKIFGLDKEPGLVNVLLGTNDWQECVLTITDIMIGKLGVKDIINTPGIDNLHIITSGSPPLNPSELLESTRMNEFLENVKQKYDLVLIDTTPVLPAADAAILASKVDGVILVYEIGRTARGALKRTKVQLENVNAKILGIVLNSLKAELNTDYKEFRYHEYGYGENTENDNITVINDNIFKFSAIKQILKNGKWKNN